MYDVKIKNGVIVTAEGRMKADICIGDGIIKAVTIPEDKNESKETIDARGCYIMPGFIDPHSHLNDPGLTESEDFYTGTCSAAAGGITTVIEHPLTDPLPDRLIYLDEKRKIGEAKVVTDFALFGACTPGNYAELDKMIGMGAVAFKAFLPYSSEIPQLSDAELLETMKWLKGKSVVLGIHCENDSMVRYYTKMQQELGLIKPENYNQGRPEIAEIESVHRMAFLAEYTGSRVHIVHCSTPESIEIVEKAKGRGADITVETCPHFLLLDEADTKKWGVYGICNPPLRSKDTVERLWKALLEGKIDFIGSDHATYTFEEKAAGENNTFQTPAGLSGIQTCFPSFFDEAVNKRNLPLERFVRMTSTDTAKRYGLFPRKGQIAVGADADLVIFNPEKEWTVSPDKLFYKVLWTPFMERNIRGHIEKTIVRGKVVYQEGRICVDAGYGNFVPRV